MGRCWVGSAARAVAKREGEWATAVSWAAVEEGRKMGCFLARAKREKKKWRGKNKLFLNIRRREIICKIFE